MYKKQSKAAMSMITDLDDIKYTDGIPLPDAIVWDMDGTLLQSKAGKFIKSDQESKARLVLEVADRAYKATRGIKNMVAPNFHLDKSTKTRILNLINKQQEHAVEVLDIIESFDIKQALVSNNSRTAMGDKVLSLLDMRDYMLTSMFLEDMDGRKKPDPTIMDDVIERADIDDHETIWVIGDSGSDMRFAIAANDHLPNAVIPVAMGKNSRAAAFLENSEYDGHFAVLSAPLDITVMTVMSQNSLDMAIPDILEP